MTQTQTDDNEPLIVWLPGDEPEPEPTHVWIRVDFMQGTDLDDDQYTALYDELLADIDSLVDAYEELYPTIDIQAR